MTTKKTFEERAREIVGGCMCDDIYRYRDLTDPDCSWCNYGEDIAQALQKAYEQGRDETRKASGGE